MRTPATHYVGRIQLIYSGISLGNDEEPPVGGVLGRC